MCFQAFEDESLIVDSLSLNDLYEIFIDLIVIDGPQCTHFSCLSFTLNHKMECTSSSGISFLTFSNLRSVRELRSRLSLRSRLRFSIYLEYYNTIFIPFQGRNYSQMGKPSFFIIK